MPRTRHTIGPTATTGTSTTGRLHWHLGCHVSLSATIASLVVGGIQWVMRWGENQTTVKSKVFPSKKIRTGTHRAHLYDWYLFLDVLGLNKKELVWSDAPKELGWWDIALIVTSNWQALFTLNSCIILNSQIETRSDKKQLSKTHSEKNQIQPVQNYQTIHRTANKKHFKCKPA